MVAAMNRRCFVVTGASSGIGRSVALHLESLGHRVFAGVRKRDDAESLRAAGSGSVTPVIVDVTDEAAVAAAFASIADDLAGAPLDGLVNNAGVARGGPLEYLELQRLRDQLEINVVGLLSVTQQALPLLRRGPGRIVNVGSIAGRVTTPLMGPYCASKYAVEALTDALRLELSAWGIHVSVVEPGPVASDIWEKARAQFDDQLGRLSDIARERYGEQLEQLSRRLEENVAMTVPTSATDRAIAHALLAKRPKTRYLVGKPARIAATLRWLLPDRAFDRVVKAR